MARQAELEEDLVDEREWDEAFMQAAGELEAELSATEVGRAVLRSAQALEAKLTTNSGRAA